jgi:hypothetical protein
MDLVSFVSALRNALVEMGIQPRNVAAKGTGVFGPHARSGRTLDRDEKGLAIPTGGNSPR